jgi:hypothetical protein
MDQEASDRSVARAMPAMIGAIQRFASPEKLIGYTGFSPASTSPARRTAAVR